MRGLLLRYVLAEASGRRELMCGRSGDLSISKSEGRSRSGM
jgi:hypothetical protein